MRALNNTCVNRYEEGDGYTENCVGGTNLNKKGWVENAKQGRVRAKRGNQ